MNNTTLEQIISDTQSSPYIKWNDESLADLIRNDNVYNVFIFNKDGNHGYFSLLHNLTSNIEGTIRPCSSAIAIPTFCLIPLE